jgi:hypothetical protein
MLNPELVILEFDGVVRVVPVIVESEALIGALACREEVHKGLKIGIVQEIMLNSEGRLIAAHVDNLPCPTPIEKRGLKALRLALRPRNF